MLTKFYGNYSKPKYGLQMNASNKKESMQDYLDEWSREQQEDLDAIHSEALELLNKTMGLPGSEKASYRKLRRRVDRRIRRDDHLLGKFSKLVEKIFG